MVSANQEYYHRGEFLSTRHMFGFQCGSTQTCEGVEGRTRSIEHHWISRGGTCLGGGSEYALANTPAFLDPARHHPCDVHGGETKEIVRGGLGKSCSDLRKATYRCRRMGPCVEKCSGIDEDVAKVEGQGRFSRRSATNPHRGSNRRFASDCLRAGVCVDSNFESKRSRRHFRATIYRVGSRSWNLQSRTHARRGNIGDMSWTSAVSWRESVWRGSIWRRVWDSSEICRFRRSPVVVAAREAPPISGQNLGGFRPSLGNGQRESFFFFFLPNLTPQTTSASG